MKAQISIWADEECFEKFWTGQFVDVVGDVEYPTSNRDRPPKAQESVQVEGRDFGIVSLKVREVKVVGQGSLFETLQTKTTTPILLY